MDNNLEQPMRKSKQTSIFIFLLALFMLLLALYVYAFHIETKLIDVTERDIQHPNIPEIFNGVKVLQFSDTHFSEEFPHEQQRKLVNEMNKLKPDIVVFTGDLIDNFSKYGENRYESQKILSKIQASLGKYAVFGNHDRGGGGGYLYKEYMEGAGFTVLVNETEKITAKNGQSITLAGLDDFLLGKPDLHRTLSSLQGNDFNMLLVHEPDVIEQVDSYPIHFQMSGHSHGGQVQVPFVGPLITAPLATKYTEGLYEVEGTQLYVNRGLGTTRMPVRFFSQPEVSLFTLHSKK
ncbi:metallophosphoesterase [Bacillus manliponensis]|uniref:metallophosphoesterase n=1 Tax=Bacillus manliponensis TaxID=574376 RepID=UPI003511E0B0